MSTKLAVVDLGKLEETLRRFHVVQVKNILDVARESGRGFVAALAAPRAPTPTVPIDMIEACARAAHEVNRAYCAALGDFSHEPWEAAPEWQRSSAINGVRGALGGNTPEQSHESWKAQKVADGWVYGAVKDPAAKTHPCLVPYAALPKEQQAKDGLYLTTVRAVAAALGHQLTLADRPVGLILHDDELRCAEALNAAGYGSETGSVFAVAAKAVRELAGSKVTVPCENHGAHEVEPMSEDEAECAEALHEAGFAIGRADQTIHAIAASAIRELHAFRQRVAALPKGEPIVIHVEGDKVVPVPQVGPAVVLLDKDAYERALESVRDQGTLIAFEKALIQQPAEAVTPTFLEVPRQDVDPRLSPKAAILAFEEKDHELYDEAWIGRSEERDVALFVDSQWFRDRTPKTFGQHTNLVGFTPIPHLHRKAVSKIKVEVVQGKLEVPARVSFHYAMSEAFAFTVDPSDPESFEVLTAGMWRNPLTGEEQWRDGLDVLGLESVRVVVAAPDQQERARLRVSLIGSLLRPCKEGEEPLPPIEEYMSADADADALFADQAEMGDTLGFGVEAAQALLAGELDKASAAGVVMGLLSVLEGDGGGRTIDEALAAVPAEEGARDVMRRFFDRLTGAGLIVSDESGTHLTDAARALFKTLEPVIAPR